MRFVAVCLMALGFAGAVQAQPQLIAVAKVDNGSDLSGLTGTLENGDPANMLGGLGSGISYLGGDRFAVLPDRGPNAKEYNALVDNTTSYVSRFQVFGFDLVAQGQGLPFAVAAGLKGTVLLHKEGAEGAFLTGKSDGFDPEKGSERAENARFDPEGIRVASDGAVYISDEYGPVLYRFNMSGERTRVYALPAHLAVDHPAPLGETEDKTNTSGRTGNKGMEGLALTPDERTLVGIMQSPLLQDGGVKAGTVRIVTVDRETGATAEYAYPLDNLGTMEAPKYTGVNEILAINDHDFLVLERDGKGLGDGSAAKVKRVYRIDLADAARVDDVSGAEALKGKAVVKTLVVDLVAVAGAGGVAAEAIPAKIEGMTFGRDVTIGGEVRHTLWLSGDNDFLDLPNMMFVVGLSDADLPGLDCSLCK